VIADLHCHYPMHVMMDEPQDRLRAMTRVRGRPLGDKLRAIVLRIASGLFSDRDQWSGERVNVDYLKRGDVRLVFSVLHSPFSEMDLSRRYGSPPASSYFDDLTEQIDQVEADFDKAGTATTALVKDVAQLDRAIETGSIAMVHCLEGGVDLGPSDQEIESHVAELARRGVVYITLAHLFYRQVATNTPAIPFLADGVYNWIFRQPKDEGLTDRGRTAVRAMVRNGVMVDLAHMRGDALAETFGILDELAPDMPVINSHAGYRFGGQEYMLDEPTVERIAKRRGVIGLILAQHQLNDGVTKRKTETFEESFEVIRQHVDRIRSITGSHEYVAIGSDFDGFIKPTMGGLETMGDLALLETALRDTYGDRAAAQMTFGNAERVLRSLWGFSSMNSMHSANAG
jgi:microsomal dipeptidase-like Zn-dependent dipeptidase